MFKSIIFITLMLAACFDMGGQNVLRGTVVDKNGNPVVGTKVSLKNGKQFTTTDFEGKFEIQANPGDKAVFDCVGMQEKTVKLEQNMTVPLKKTTIWNRRPTKWDVFINAQIMWDYPSFGLMAGAVKNVGGYVKYMMTPDVYASRVTPDYYKHSLFSGGVIVNLHCPLYAYLGGGYYVGKACDNYTSREWKINRAESSFAFDIGLVWRFNHISINVGAMIPSFDVELRAISFGVGYIF